MGRSIRIKSSTKAWRTTQVNLKKAASILENYANANIKQNQKGFGDFMYHAELLRNGHLDVHKSDMPKVDKRYRAKLETLISPHLKK